MRKSPRYPLDIRAHLTFPKNGFLQRVTVRTVDIGVSGLAVTSPTPLPEGAAIDVDVTLPGVRVAMRLKATIRNKSGFRYGIEFLSTTDVQKDEITRFGNGKKPASGLGPSLPGVPVVN